MIVNDDFMLLLFTLTKAVNPVFSDINRLGEHDGI